MKLSGEQTQKAWEDYKGFIDSMGLRVMPGVEQAFKMGFAMGQAKEEEKQDKPPIQAELLPRITLNGKELASRIKRRTEKQREHDAELVGNLLKRNGEMNGKEVCEAMNKAGSDWYIKSVHGHMRVAMARNPKIIKIGSLYSYADN